MLTGRAENHIRGNPDLDDTIRRLQAYEQAGADVLYAPGLRTADEIRRMFADFFAASNTIRHEILNIVVEEAAGKVATEQSYVGELKDGTVNDMHNCNFFDFDADGRFKRVIIWMAGTSPLK